MEGVRALRASRRGPLQGLLAHGDQGMDGQFRLGDAVEAGFGHGFGGDVAPGEARADFGKEGLIRSDMGRSRRCGARRRTAVGSEALASVECMFLDGSSAVGRECSHRAVQRLDGMVSTSARISIYAMMSALRNSPNLASVPSSGRGGQVSQGAPCDPW